MNKKVLNNTDIDQTEQGFSDVVSNVISEYESLPKTSKTNSWITTRIKEVFGELGANNNYDVCSTIHDNEWLYDLVWYTKDTSNNKLNKVILVLESELSNRKPQALLYDFNKLLLSNSDYRVFICFNAGNYNFPDNINSIIGLFEESVASYNNLSPNSRILILIWDDYTTGKLYPHLIQK
jgi:hypothetical protein